MSLLMHLSLLLRFKPRLLAYSPSTMDQNRLDAVVALFVDGDGLHFCLADVVIHLFEVDTMDAAVAVLLSQMVEAVLKDLIIDPSALLSHPSNLNLRKMKR